MKPSVKHGRFLAARQTVLINKNFWKEQIKSRLISFTNLNAQFFIH